MKETKIAGIILSGGKSSRFGRPKAFEQFNGKPFYQYAYEALAPYSDEAAVVSHAALTERFTAETNFNVIEDQPPYIGKGPLSGLYAAMKLLKADYYFILACDMPLFDETAAGKLLQQLTDESLNSIVPRSEGRIHPLCAIYHKDTLPELEKQLETGSYRMKEWLNRIDVSVLDEKEHCIPVSCFKNVNDQQELSAIYEIENNY
ncbi:molybdenum cofactor guanylyltransferase [Jeotgalibacillus proteolyticus]|uniref:Probable molybdenum cofactor guanylyltransferase n=1 Tax=Jeotgalibacillus proteolyticus TaxID=2082395 RepID=A0A2S5GCH9_9BACL|nr:molybdenum cofactor guanylyltransferase [Jeotgalibacillus proteolyticus]PPA70710.1 hypothetical protein C4B60_07900 [Jeotgalibacillus proteolyticus]